LKRVWIADDHNVTDFEDYPLNQPWLNRGDFELEFEKPVTIIVGENGSGKSTLLEALATVVGFSEAGGGRGHSPVDPSNASGRDGGMLGKAFRASWLPKMSNGFFFRAETFFSLSRYLDDSGSRYADFLSHSHGEGFIRFFEERSEAQGIYIFDEPESALSPARQFEFLKLLRLMQRRGGAQIIMATHSPILMALPDADLWQMDQFSIGPTTLEETNHYQLYREFILYPHDTVEAFID
jgi:predicted ATPase